MKKAIKYSKNQKKMGDADVGNAVFRVQYAFPNIESEAVLNEKQQ